jgi:F-type H+-transporting ATPase subunit b
MLMDIASTLSTIGFDWRIALANLVNFLLIFYLLKRFAFVPIGRMLDERKRRISQGLEDARRAATERQMAEQEFERLVDEARDQANSIIATARTQEKSILAKASDQAKIEARHLMNEAQAKIEAEKAAMEREVKEKTAELVVTGVERVLRQKLNSQDRNDEFIIKSLA